MDSEQQYVQMPNPEKMLVGSINENYQENNDPILQDEANQHFMFDQDQQENQESQEYSTNLEQSCAEKNYDLIEFNGKKIQGVPFQNNLFNPQFDVQNPIYGISQKNEAVMNDKQNEYMAINFQNRILGQDNLQYGFTNKLDLDADIEILPHIPLIKNNQDNIFTQSDLQHEKIQKEMKSQNDTLMISLFKDITLMLIIMLLIQFFFDVIPNYYYYLSNNGIQGYEVFYLAIQYDQSLEKGSFFSVLSLILMILFVKFSQYMMEKKYEKLLNREYQHCILIQNIPYSCNQYDIINMIKKELGANYGILEIVMVNSYSELIKMQKLLQKKLKKPIQQNTTDLEEIQSYLSRKYSIIDTPSLQKLVENEIKSIKLGVKFQNAAIVVMQSKTMVEHMIYRCSTAGSFLNLKKALVLGDNYINIHEITEPFDLNWENLKYTKFQQVSQIFLYSILVSLIYQAIAFFAGLFDPFDVTPNNDIYKQFLHGLWTNLLIFLFDKILENFIKFVIRKQRLHSKQEESLMFLQITIVNFFFLNSINIFSSLYKYNQGKDIRKVFYLYLATKYVFMIIMNALKPFLQAEIIWGNLIQKYKKYPKLQWKFFIKAFMKILMITFIFRYLSIYTTFFSILALYLNYKYVTDILLSRYKWQFDSPSIMQAKNFFYAVEQCFYLYIVLNLFAGYYNNKILFTLMIVGLVSVFILFKINDYIYKPFFNFKISKNSSTIMENTEYRFIPYQIRNYFFQIDRNLSLNNIGNKLE